MTPQGLVVNEIAPRVHNSGHWTQNGCTVDQFEQHIRAITGLPLGDAGRHADVVMENLIGDDMDRVPELLAARDVGAAPVWQDGTPRRAQDGACQTGLWAAAKFADLRMPLCQPASSVRVISANRASNSVRKAGFAAPSAAPKPSPRLAA